MNDDDLLFHYTSAQGLLRLLGKPRSPAKLWMTQINYLNDSAEARYAYELTASELRRLEKQCPNLKRAAAGLSGIPQDGQEWGPPTPFSVTRECTFSVSETGDLLSHRRGHARVGGYSVGYRYKDLEEFAANQGLRLSRCIYDEEEQRKTVSDKLVAIEEALTRGETEGLLLGVPEHDRARSTASVRFQSLVNWLAPIFKHPSFQEEREWRLIGMIGVKDPRARYRHRGNLIMPYAEIDVGPKAPRPLRPAKIIVGPDVDFELAKRSISDLTFNFAKPELQLEVVQSRSTLRPRYAPTA